jgi:hypothetical protein
MGGSFSEVRVSVLIFAIPKPPSVAESVGMSTSGLDGCMPCVGGT